MEFLFKHFGKLWLLMFGVILTTGITVLCVGVWAVIKLVNHFT